jgi:hypothetical protein
MPFDDDVKDLLAFTTKAELLTDEVTLAFDILGETTLTTTLAKVKILAPMPITGSWSGGATMRLSALLADLTINNDAIILPDYELEHHILDDKCEPVENSRLVLEAMALDTTYVALGGAGCSDVCAGTSFIAKTMNLPFLSYDCPDPALSAVLEYEGLTRFGTVAIDDATFRALKVIGDNNSWEKIFVVSGDLEEEQAVARVMMDKLGEVGFATENIRGRSSASATYLKPVFESIMAKTRDVGVSEYRNVFVVGTETFFRKLLCAAAKTSIHKGIAWISQGTWRDNWWNRSDSAYTFQSNWVKDEVAGYHIRDAFNAFKAGWDNFTVTNNNLTGLQDLYKTDLKEDLYSIDAPFSHEYEAAYHAAHAKEHSYYRALMSSRGYNDIFLIDLQGNVMYSVYKEDDFGTNLENGPLSNSGLAESYRLAKGSPDDYHETNKGYTTTTSCKASKVLGVACTVDEQLADYPPKGEQVSFFSHGIYNSSDCHYDECLIGYYVIQLPSSYEQSPDKYYYEDCNKKILTDSFEGAINIGSLGRPPDAELDMPAACFAGHTVRSFRETLESSFKTGLVGNKDSAVADPFPLIQGNAADGACVIAMMVRHFLQQGRSMEEIKKPNEEMYDAIQSYIKTQLDFQGISGRVKFSGNDKPGYLGVTQVQGGKTVDVGTIDLGWMDGVDANGQPVLEINTQGTIAWLPNSDGSFGPLNSSWEKEPALPPPPPAEKNEIYWVVHVIVRFILILLPICIGCLGAIGRRDKAGAGVKHSGGGGEGAAAASGGGSGA